LVGQGIDSVVFISLAFGPQWTIIVFQWLVKSAYEALATPVTYAVVGYLKRVEGLDVFDRRTSLSPFAWRSMGSTGEEGP
jgi:uncharacterized PurR-regulated membrane protein YhhQ (DUF165 family)